MFIPLMLFPMAGRIVRFFRQARREGSKREKNRGRSSGTRKTPIKTLLMNDHWEWELRKKLIAEENVIILKHLELISLEKKCGEGEFLLCRERPY
ncbi:hypothetical protein TNIN_210841 [Trichonephila inaurata madagascariensis]|uniref:Uncharacterized protein n=1 Tax=Trichonephila inaurata madagascariensis TaxID=2747483 RepID=A0A8X6WXM4_9ARAC|nr:hypothetical protein TNIN_210841 [Trichonephila inaurata madagascariensis]